MLWEASTVNQWLSVEGARGARALLPHSEAWMNDCPKLSWLQFACSLKLPVDVYEQ